MIDNDDKGKAVIKDEDGNIKISFNIFIPSLTLICAKRYDIWMCH